MRAFAYGHMRGRALLMREATATGWRTYFGWRGRHGWTRYLLEGVHG